MWEKKTTQLREKKHPPNGEKKSPIGEKTIPLKTRADSPKWGKTL